MRKSIIMIAAAMVVSMTGCINHGPGQTSPQVITAAGESVIGSRVINVTSKESVSVVPDMAEIAIGVTNQDPDAKVCQDKNAESVNALLETLKSLGIAETSIQTSNYNLSTQNDWNNNGEIIGYEMVTELRIKDIALEKVGDVLAASVTSGANQINSVTYSSSKYDESYQEALAKAVATARLKAESLANAGGCALGQIVGITESANNQAARYQNNAALKMESPAGGAGSSAEMMPGEIAVEASISVEFMIQ